VIASGDSIRVLSRASGGELEVSPELLAVLRGFQEGMSLDFAFRMQRVWNEDRFAQFVAFLYRNDYLVISRCEELDRSPLVMKEAAYA
jgi:hypothetical protein